MNQSAYRRAIAFVGLTMICACGLLDARSESVPFAELQGYLQVGAANGWSGTLEGKTYRLGNNSSTRAVRYFYTVPPAGVGAKQVSVKVQAVASEATQPDFGGAGLLWGFNPDSQDYYACVLRTDGAVAIYRSRRQGVEQLTVAHREEIAPGTAHHLSVKTRVGGFECYVDEKDVGGLDIEGVAPGAGYGLIAIGAGHYGFEDFETKTMPVALPVVPSVVAPEIVRRPDRVIAQTPSQPEQRVTPPSVPPVQPTPPPIPPTPVVPPSPEYFVVVKGQTTGPFTLEQLQQDARAGRLHGNMLVWTERFGNHWAVANNVPDLAGFLPQVSQPPPVPVPQPTPKPSPVAKQPLPAPAPVSEFPPLGGKLEIPIPQQSMPVPQPQMPPVTDIAPAPVYPVRPEEPARWQTFVIGSWYAKYPDPKNAGSELAEIHRFESDGRFYYRADSSQPGTRQIVLAEASGSYKVQELGPDRILISLNYDSGRDVSANLLGQQLIWQVIDPTQVRDGRGTTRVRTSF